MPFLSGLAAGMIVSSIGGAIALAIDARKNAKGQAEVLAPATHYHITLDEDSTLPEFLQEKKKVISKPSPSLKVADDFIAKVLDVPPVDRTIDWKAAFAGAKKEETKNVRDEKGKQAIEAPRPSDSKNNSNPVSPSRARAEKRERQDRKKGK